MSRNDEQNKNQEVREKVRAGYASIAVAKPQVNDSGCCSGTSCCGADSADDATALASAIGYASQDLASLPDGANMGLSCGNPTALAGLTEGEVVVDLGSGGGFDVFIAGGRVGPTGRAIGVDMTPEMLSKARRNAATYRERTGIDNVEFRLGEIEHLPLPDNSADVIISNCVINLSPDKDQVWREIARVLKPGGRVAVSDLALVQPLPEEISSMVEALVGCVAGAVLISETERMAKEAGLTEIVLERKGDYVDAMTSWNDPLYAKIAAALPGGAKISDYVTSLNVSARKV
ncbi:arsenite S-adenosylmethyltransferase [candidate division BRC1 bacterium HGW-BRC1-1]|jgi:SAM-dependent methyltransferase|nr:MAG: arsenite S-adenosylmethyltransferase [candidate division BRC1 bacterium HGW-BRC1-1]